MSGTCALCKSCDLMVELQAYRRRVTCVCPRCNSVLRSGKKADLRTSAIIGMGALILLVVTISNPFITISSYGLTASISIDSLFSSLQRDWSVLLIFFLACTMFCPLLMIAMQIAAGLCGFRPGKLSAEVYSFTHRSCFVDVMILGLLVSMIKLTMMASITFHIGFYFGMVFALICIWCWSNVTPDDYWNLVSPCSLSKADVHPGIRGLEQGYILCRHCHMAYRGGNPSCCPRCSHLNALRHEGSSGKTALYLAAAIILYLPSNIYPIMFTTYLGNSIGSNIIDGVIALWKMDSYMVSIVILVASIFIPIFKISSLIYILLRIRYGKFIDARRMSLIYRMVEFIGKWSMVDVFVVIIMTTTVRMTGLLVIDPGIAIVIFFAVVIVTMIAAWTFDERLIWDKYLKQKNHD